MIAGQDLILPPRLYTQNGKDRRVGVEMEFAALSAKEAAILVQSLFGGAIAEVDPHRFAVKGTIHGDYICELDNQYAHPEKYAPGVDEPPKDGMARFRHNMAALIGSVSELVVPVEIVGPPMPIARLVDLGRLTQSLRRLGAQGTRASLLYAFGLQLNPEAASLEADDVRAVLQAFLIVAPWLRARIDMDVSRRLLAFAEPFPLDYALKVIAPDYRPGLARLIDDYIDHNPTRNRECDFLPLFAHLDGARVRSRLDDPLIKSRPTFHYRLPDARLEDPDWSVVKEWNDWVQVEKLADDPDKLTKAAEAYSAAIRSHRSAQWPQEVTQWLS